MLKQAVIIQQRFNVGYMYLCNGPVGAKLIVFFSIRVRLDVTWKQESLLILFLEIRRLLNRKLTMKIPARSASDNDNYKKERLSLALEGFLIPVYH